MMLGDEMLGDEMLGDEMLGVGGWPARVMGRFMTISSTNVQFV